MSARRSAGAMIGGAALLIAALLPARALAPESGLSVCAVPSGFVEARPLNTVTLVFRVVNATARAHEFAPRVALPEGWSLIIEETGFELGPGEERLCLVPVYVPVRAAMGSYRVSYALAARDDPSLSGRAETEVRVLLEAKLAVEATETYHLAVAGETCRSAFLVSNRSNASLSVTLEVRSNGPGVAQELRSARLDAGESRSVGITVATDPKLTHRLEQQVQLTATALVPEKGLIGGSATTELEVIPRVSGHGDYFNRFPVEAGFMAIGTSAGPGYGQYMLSGSGALDADGTRLLDFYFRGPGRSDGGNLAYAFGLQPDEYRMSYTSDSLRIHAGDGTYALTRLTETGSYGRGLDVDASFGRWSVRGYFENLLFQSDTGGEKALQLGWRPADRTSFSLSYLTRQDNERPTASQILSLRSELVRKLFHLSLEYSWDWSTLPGIRPANSALWFEGGQSYKNWSSEITFIRAGAQYHGYYQDMDYDSVEASYACSTKWGVRGSFRDQKTDTAVEPYFQPFDDRTVQGGAYYQAFPRLSFSLDVRIHDSQDLSSQPEFDYQDSTLRPGAFFFAGTFNLQAFVDIGRTFNRLTRSAEALTEYTLSANYLAVGRVSLAAYLHYRDQGESFTGDKIRCLDMNFNIGLTLGRFTCNGFYRTAVLQDLYQNPLSRENFEDPAFLLNNSDTFGVSLTYRFRNGHSLGFRLQRVVNPLFDGQPPKALIGLVEYSVPVGIPVSRKTSVGKLRGRVYDTEEAGRGIPGVIVKANDLAAVTDAKGEFVFNGLAPGLYTLSLDDRLAGAGKVPVVRMPLTVMVEGGQATDCPIGLTTGARIAGRILVYEFENSNSSQSIRREGESRDPADPASPSKAPGEGAAPQLVERMPLCAATIELRGGGEVFEQVSDADGRFLFDGLRSGTYTLQVSADDLPEFHVLERDTFELDLRPGAKEEIAVRVLPIARSIQIIDRGEIRIKKNKDGGR